MVLMDWMELQAKMDLMALLDHQEKRELLEKTGLVSLVNADLRAQLEPLEKMVFQAMQELLARMVLMVPLVSQASLANQVPPERMVSTELQEPQEKMACMELQANKDQWVLLALLEPLATLAQLVCLVKMDTPVPSVQLVLLDLQESLLTEPPLLNPMAITTRHQPQPLTQHRFLTMDKMEKNKFQNSKIALSL